MSDRLIDAKELSSYLKVRLTWVWMAGREGKIPCIRVGKYMRFNLEDVIECLSNSDMSIPNQKLIA